MVDPIRQAANLAQQAELYGAALGDTVREVSAALDLSQAAVARALGLSAPMLSQLVSGQRIKIGNPQAVQRLQSLLALATEVREGLAHDQIAPRLEAIRMQAAGTLTQSRSPAPDVPTALSQLLRTIASGRELSSAANLLDEAGHGEIAALLRIYGTGPAQEAAEHYAATQP